MNVSEALDRFLVQLRADGRSTHTVKQYARHVRALDRWLEANGHSRQVADLNDQTVAMFLVSPDATTTPDGRAKNPASMNALRGSVKGFGRYLHRSGLVHQDPARLVRRARMSPPPPRALRPSEQERLLELLRAATGFEARRDLVLIELMLGTGLRLSSALGLDVEDLDLDDGVARVRSVKGGGELRVFLTDAVCKRLREHLEGRSAGPVFATASGRRLSSRQAQRRFAAWRDRASVSVTATPHACRHAFAMALYDRTGDVLLVRHALGHRSISSTAVYARTSEEHVRSAVRRGA